VGILTLGILSPAGLEERLQHVFGISLCAGIFLQSLYDEVDEQPAVLGGLGKV
jgi:hypothetical protein